MNWKTIGDVIHLILAICELMAYIRSKWGS
jgi:hypothetical protein